MQLEFFNKNKENNAHTQFSHDNFADDSKRIEIENRYNSILEETDSFNRRLVSFQASKKKILHQWIKYREGFSSELVENLMDEFDLKEGDTVLDPFLGSGTTALTAKTRGINAVGMDILPNTHLTFEAKNNVFNYDIDELKSIYEQIKNINPDIENVRNFPHVKITEHAFSEQTEKELMFYTDWFENAKFSKESKILLKLLLTSILEEISYTRKDGQYLKWDGRSKKVIKNNEIRLSNGKKSIKGLDKGELPSPKKALLDAFEIILNDIKTLQSRDPFVESKQTLIKDSVLSSLPKMNDAIFDAVITSPPYCNRYDYTRTYALELAYLGENNEDIKDLRQNQLSCTVENRLKIDQLRDYYISIGYEDRFKEIENIIQSNETLNEIIQALEKREKNGDINNKGVIRMVQGYFTELTFTFFEIFRTCKSGSKIAFVNDNVRYAGEIIPVDFLSTKIAEDIGFKPVKIYSLKQKKGNSSQQMKKYGRAPLRKSITIWEKV